MVSIESSPPKYLTPRTPPRGTATPSKILDQLDLPNSEEASPVRAFGEGARVAAGGHRVNQAGFPKLDVSGCFRRRIHRRQSSHGESP